MPLGVASEYNCNGCLPMGSSFSSSAPAVGRLIFSNLPPLGASHFQTLGGIYFFITHFLFYKTINQLNYRIRLYSPKELGVLGASHSLAQTHIRAEITLTPTISCLIIELRRGGRQRKTRRAKQDRGCPLNLLE